MHIELLQHETSFGLLKGDIYHATIEKNSNVLFVHGGGLRGRKGFEAIRTKLAFHGISTYAFDFVGHGDTSGDITTFVVRNKSKAGN
jgi:pimeloyl-ACP methyl ester carboxylesterase